MLKLTLLDGRAVWIVAARIITICPNMERNATYIYLDGGSAEPTIVKEDANRVAEITAQRLNVVVHTIN